MLLSIVECSDHEKKLQSATIKELRTCSNSGVESVLVSGPSAASMRNCGAGACRADWIFFKDKDCRIDPSVVLAEVSKVSADDNSVGAIGGWYDGQDSTALAQSYSHIQKTWVRRGAGEQSPIHLLGGALLVRRTAFDQLGGFNESIGWGGEETEFIQRLVAKGWKTRLSRSLVVVHKNDLSLAGFFKRAWVQNYNRGFYSFSQPCDQGSSVTAYFKTKIKNRPFIFAFLFTGIAAYCSARTLKWFASPGKVT